MKTAFLLNPRARKGMGMRAWYAIEPEVEYLFPHFESFSPTDEHQLREVLTFLVYQSYNRLIVVGGDGTLNRVINLLLEEFPDFARTVILGILPMGTGNDLARSAGFSKSVRENLKILQEGYYDQVDVGKITYSLPTQELKTGYFLNMLTLGVSTLAVEAMHESSSPSPFSYFGVLLKKLTDYTPYPIRMFAQEKLLYSGPILVICVANGRYAGGGFPLLPTAELADGKFHSLVITTMPFWKQMCMLPLICIGKQPFREKILCTTNYVRIESDIPNIAFETDGELPGYLPLEIQCIPQAIHLIQKRK